LNQITPLGWLGIAIILLITVGVNVLMVSLLRSREKMDELGRYLRDRKPSATVRIIQQMRETTRDPFKTDREQINELSKLVSNLPHGSGAEGDAHGKEEKSR
jgi:hypothetical protein